MLTLDVDDVKSHTFFKSMSKANQKLLLMCWNAQNDINDLKSARPTNNTNGMGEEGDEEDDLAESMSCEESE